MWPKGHDQLCCRVLGELARQVGTMGLVAAASISSQSMILGHLMVHELGHLLLDTDSHSPRGIMSSPGAEASSSALP